MRIILDININNKNNNNNDKKSYILESVSRLG